MTQNVKMTVDSGGGGLGGGGGGGGGPLVEEDPGEKEICARLINYHSAYNSQDMEACVCVCG